MPKLYLTGDDDTPPKQYYGVCSVSEHPAREEIERIAAWLGFREDSDV